MIHEGTHGIQGMDLLGRKVLMEEGRGMQLLAARMTATITRASAVPALAAHAKALGKALQDVGTATQAAWATGNPTDALANAVPYLQADPALAKLDTQGRLGCTQFFFLYELPKIGAWLGVVQSRDLTCAAFPEGAF
jgi:butyryl-CoA dehydrogenase